MVWIVAIAVALYLLHRLALWAEEKGWIYYARKRAHPDAMGAAALELQQHVNPGVKHVLEITRKRRADKKQDSAKGHDK